MPSCACMVLRSFCRECIEGAMGAAAGGHRCPCCSAEGRQTLLGANPWASGRLQPDFVLDALIRKILPEVVRQRLIWQRVQVRRSVPCPPAFVSIRRRPCSASAGPLFLACVPCGAAAGAGIRHALSCAGGATSGEATRMHEALRWAAIVPQICVLRAVCAVPTDVARAPAARAAPKPRKGAAAPDTCVRGAAAVPAPAAGAPLLLPPVYSVLFPWFLILPNTVLCIACTYERIDGTQQVPRIACKPHCMPLPARCVRGDHKSQIGWLAQNAWRQERATQPGKQAQQWQLEAPYLRVPKHMPLSVLAKYVALRLHAPERARVDLFCRDSLLRPAETVRAFLGLALPASVAQACRHA